MPPVYRDLFKPKRYKVYYGGRGGAKSYNFGLALLLIGRTRTVRILCAREIQKSIKQSVKALFENLIKKYGFSDYLVKDTEITNRWTGSVIFFEGLWRNVLSIKSTEDVDICWVEEAQAVSKESLINLIPTIRKENSEIWFSYNRNAYLDPVHKMIALDAPDDKKIVHKVTYLNVRDYISDTLFSEIESLKKSNPQLYKHVGLGEPYIAADGNIFMFNRAKNLVDYVEYDSIQIEQVPKTQENSKGILIHIVSEFQDTNQPPEYYVKWLKKNFPESWRGFYHAIDPYTGVSRGASLQSWVTLLEGAGLSVYMEHAFSPEEMIMAANEILPYVRISEKQAPLTLEALELWQRKRSRVGDIEAGAKPVHDKYSHPGSAFYYFVANRFPPVSYNSEVIIV